MSHPANTTLGPIIGWSWGAVRATGPHPAPYTPTLQGRWDLSFIFFFMDPFPMAGAVYTTSILGVINCPLMSGFQVVSRTESHSLPPSFIYY